MSSCLGFRKGKGRDDEHAPLLPRYDDETALQRRLHQKLHTYQMYRAMANGFMPSTEQVVANLRTLIASDVLNPEITNLSDSGRILVKHTKELIKQFIGLLLNKNGQDQIQDAIWFMTKSSIALDTQHVQNRAVLAKTKADTRAAFKSLQTVGSLLLTNSDFRIFLSDLEVIGREVFRDSAQAVSKAAENASQRVDPDAGSSETDPVQQTDQSLAPTQKQLEDDPKQVSKIVAGEAEGVRKQVGQSIAENLSVDERQMLFHRLKNATVSLRQRKDYSDSVSTIGLLIKRYAMVYSRALEETAGAAEDAVQRNDEVDEAFKKTWSLITSFGSKEEWEKLETLLKQLIDHHRSNPDFEKLMNDIGNAVQRLLSEPEQLQDLDSFISTVRKEANDAADGTHFTNDLQKFLEQTRRTFKSVKEDKDVAALINTSWKILKILSPDNSIGNQDLVYDLLYTLLPMAISLIQYIPIPRIEVSTPDIDLLLENLIIEPGTSVNKSSFLPFRFGVLNTNEVEIRKTHSLRTTATASNHITVKLDGLSVRADELGYWMRVHPNIFLRFVDSGIASFAMDKRGIDIHMDLELVTRGPDNRHLVEVVHLKAVRVHVHKFDYALRSSNKFSCLAWFLKPLLRPILRKTIEKQVAIAIADGLHAFNRELVYARERLRATRIADPDDMITFFRAIAARLTPEADPDLYARVAVDQPGKGVFKGRYAPGSVVKLWHEEALQARERIDEGEFNPGGWRNAVFDLPAATTTTDYGTA